MRPRPPILVRLRGLLGMGMFVVVAGVLLAAAFAAALLAVAILVTTAFS